MMFPAEELDAALVAATHEGPTGFTLCDDCCDRLATETWDYSDAPIPTWAIPAPDHFCESCADRRRDRWLEDHS